MSKCKFLWVDDNPPNNELLTKVYTKIGVKIKTVKNTQEAIEYLRKEKIDLIISDMGRFGESDAGIRMISDIKNLEGKNENTPIFVYASDRAIKKYGESAKKGATIATASARDLVVNINKLLKRKSTEILNIEFSCY